MESHGRLTQFSNYYYNEGLRCATVNDISGAIERLKKSLRYNKNNIDARNLLGLCYYEIGECVLALKEWVISINLKGEDNLAAEYIDDIQPDITRTGRFNMSVKKYNQALLYANEGNEDLAIVQLKRVLGLNPKFICAAELLALLYIHNKQLKEAKDVIENARKVDANNVTLMCYLKEVEEELKRKEDTKKKKSKSDIDIGTVSYESGSDTIIRPSYFKDNATITSIVNIVFGLVIGILISFFLIVPGVKKNARQESASKLVEANNAISTKNATIKDLQSKVDELNKKISAMDQTTEDNASNMSFYKSMLAMYVSFNNGNYIEAGEALTSINESQVDPDFKETYETLKVEVNDKYCQILYASASSNYNQGNYEEAITVFEKIVKLNPTYGDGNALYFLAQSYRMTGDDQKAITNYQRLLDECPDSGKASNAKRHIENLTR